MSESKLQTECFKLLTSMGIYSHSVPNEAEGRSIIKQAQLVSMGLRKGVADLVVWWRREKRANLSETKESGIVLPILTENAKLSDLGGLETKLAIPPYGAVIGYVEFKDKKGKLSQSQLTFKRLCDEHGISYDVVRSIDEMKEVINVRNAIYGE